MPAPHNVVPSVTGTLSCSFPAAGSSGKSVKIGTVRSSPIAANERARQQ